MALQIWIPGNGSLVQKGLSSLQPVVNGTTAYTTGKIGEQALSCNGSTFWKITNFTCGKNVSFCCWAKTTVDTKMLWVITSTSSNRLNLYSAGVYALNTGDGVKNPFQTSSGSTIPVLLDGLWHHYVVVFSGDNKAKLYIDGTYRGTAKTYKNPTMTNAAMRIAGGYQDGHSYDWNGAMNDFRVYDHSLSDQEIKIISQGLVGHYKLDETSLGYTHNYLSASASKATVSAFSFASSSSNKYYNIGAITTNVNDIFTYSMYINNISNGNFRIAVRALKKDGTYTGYSYSNYINAGDAGYVSVTWNLRDSSVYTGNIYVRLYSNLARSAITTNPETGFVQLENNPVRTDWILGGTYRARGPCFDDSGYNHNGNISGTIMFDTLTPRYKFSSKFDGTTFIALGRGVMVKDELTVSCWIRNDASGAEGARIITSCQTGGIQLMYKANGTIHWIVGTGTSSNTYKEIDTPLVYSTDIGVWHHVCCTYNGLVNKIYIDGVEVISQNCYSTKTPIFYNATNGTFIAAEANTNQTTPTNDKRFTGAMSDVRFYATALSAADVLELYNTSMIIDSNGNILPRTLST